MFVVELSPAEDVTPVTQVVRTVGQPVPENKETVFSICIRGC